MDELPDDNTSDSLFLSLVQPSSCLTRKCSMDVTNLVEQALSKETSAEKSKKLKDVIKMYHTIQKEYPRIYVCTESRSRDHNEHQEFSVKMISNCSLSPKPIFRKESTLNVFTSDSNAELFSVVCPSLSCDSDSGSLQNTKEYTCQCSVKVVLDVEGVEEVKYEAKFNQTVMFRSEFEIRLQRDSSEVLLQSNKKYGIKVQFSDVHPLCFASDNEIKAQDKRDVKVQCAEVVGEEGNFGSHIKYILYRIL